MKKILLLLSVLSSMSYINAQYSISYDSMDPITVVAGQSITLNYTYSASMEVDAQFQIFETDVPQIFGGTTADGTTVAEFPTLAVATDQANTITLTIPANFPLSSSLSGTEYRIFGKLSSALETDATEDVFWANGSGEYPQIIVTAPNYSITYDSANPITVAPGQSVTLDYTYSASMDVTAQFQIFEADSPTIFGGATNNASAVIATPNLTAGSNVATSVTLDIPSDFPASSTLSGTNYYIFGKLSSSDNSDANSDADWSVSGNYPEIIVDETLSTDDITFDSNKLYFNNASASLVINNSIQTESLSIFNTTGKKIYEIDNLKDTSTINLSALPKGLYIARSDSKYLKFVR